MQADTSAMAIGLCALRLRRQTLPLPTSTAALDDRESEYTLAFRSASAPSDQSELLAAQD